MHIKSIAITNYKSFYEKQILNLEPGFNLLVGANNSGKTSILDVIDLDPALNEPHRSERTIPYYGGHNNEPSELEVTLETRFEELWKLVGSNQLYLPINITADEFVSGKQIETISEFIKNNNSIQINSLCRQGSENVTITSTNLINGNADKNIQTVSYAALIQFNPKLSTLQIDITSSGANSHYIGNLAQNFKSRIYRFSAHRRPGMQCVAQSTPILDREAVTLPYCINHLQTNDAHGHQLLCELVNRVFPSVKWVQATPNNGSFEIRCLPCMPDARRDDLATPMSRMGAGIGNVIAMFYVVLTAREPQVIAIDEPNAFLHPRALRELLAILESEGKKHQFILTAHSADVLTAVNTQTISLLHFDGIATTVKQVGPKELHSLRSELAELGIRMTDLHAKDRVFWVEGQTEEIVIPELLRWACPEVAAGTSVLRVERTGTFSKKSIEPKEVMQIYERLSTASALVPPMVCILLDGETRKTAEREQIEADSNGKLRFLERRMLENYLLHPKAVLASLTELGLETNIEIITKLLTTGISSQDISTIDGANILKSIYSTVSNASHEFRKTRDVQAMITWLLKNDPEYLTPLRNCLRKSFVELSQS